MSTPQISRLRINGLDDVYDIDELNDEIADLEKYIIRLTDQLDLSWGVIKELKDAYESDRK